MTKAETPARDGSPGGSGRTSRIHPIVKLDHFVRIIACPILALLVVTARTSAGETIPNILWAALGAYALIWPHVARYAAQRIGGDIRRTEMRSLVVDAVVSGGAIALASFQLVPTLTIFTGLATILGSVGGITFLLLGMFAFISSLLIVGATVTGFSVALDGTPVSIVLSAAGLVAFQTMMGLLTYRTARNFIKSRRRIAEQAEEIRVQNAALEEAREEALQAAQAKAAFLATMSHEIRTPLNGVLGMTSLLADTRMTPEQQDFVRTIQVSGTTLLSVINDVLDFSRIESGRLELEAEPLSVRGVVEEALEIVGPRARETGIELICEVEPDVPELILGDAVRIRQVLTNLAGNAVKFTEEGEVVVTVSLLQPTSENSRAEIEFRVSDTGIGIPEDRLPLLFVPFSQADASTTRRFGGTGLGLAISKRLTELMGGTISAKSTAGVGSTFSFTIKAAVAQDRRRVPRLSAANITGQRVLVVDDNATNRRVLCAQLSSWGMKPQAARNAEEAMSLLSREGGFVLAILDLHMPDVDGMTLAQRIRGIEAVQGLPLILLSSSLVQSKDDPARLFNVRLMKPVRQSKLFDSIVRILDRADASDRSDLGTGPGLHAVPMTAPLKILVADDNEVNRKVARLVLRRIGYEAAFVENGVEAVDAVSAAWDTEDAFDLVLMDVHMPEMDGLQATRRIRRVALRHPDRVAPRIVAMTADAMPEDREICLEAGMDDYLTKPLDFDAVRAMLEKTAALRKGVGVVARESRSESEEPIQDPTLAASNPSVIDWARLDELRSYDTPDGEMVRVLVMSFIQETSAKMLSLRSGAGVRDAETVRASAHAIKGAALNVGAITVADHARRIEDAAKLSVFDDIETLVESLSVAIPPAVQALSGATRTNTDEDPGIVPRQTV